MLLHCCMQQKIALEICHTPKSLENFHLYRNLKARIFHSFLTKKKVNFTFICALIVHKKMIIELIDGYITVESTLFFFVGGDTARFHQFTHYAAVRQTVRIRFSNSTAGFAYGFFLLTWRHFVRNCAHGNCLTCGQFLLGSMPCATLSNNNNSCNKTDNCLTV